VPATSLLLDCQTNSALQVQTHAVCGLLSGSAGLVQLAGSFTSYADDICQLLQQLNLQQAVHVGTSGGGQYACACAAFNPKTTAGLGLVAPMTHCSGPGSRQLLQGMHWFDCIGYNMIAYAPQLVAGGLVVTAPFMAAAPTVARLLLGSEVKVQSSSSSSSSSAADAPAGALQGTGSAKPPQKQQQGLIGAVMNTASRAMLQLFGAFMHPADKQLLLQQPAAFTQLLPSMLADSVV
jgi:pimeloyl-ACP methyl ester carboxylesterase